MPKRINGGQVVVVVAAITLIVSLFLGWFEPGRSAWTVFEVVDLLLAALAIAALALAIGGAIDPDGSLAALAPRWLPAVGMAALAIVIAALINHPPAAIDRPAESGAWIALAAAGALTVGGILSAARVSLVITLRPREEGAESSDPPPPPTAPNPGQPEGYDVTADEEYADEYAETEHIDAEEADAEYEEPEPTTEAPLADEEPTPPREDERA
jgi:hypothetical protein